MDHDSSTILTLEDICTNLANTPAGQEDEVFLSSSEFARKLFAKAGSDFYRRHTLASLTEITRRSLQFVHGFSKSDKPFQILSENTDAVTTIIIAIWDRPFVINSLREVIGDYGASIHAFYHPILTEMGKRISFSYIEVSQLSLESRHVLERRIANCLEHVVAVTEDFTPMLVRAETLSRALDAGTPWAGHTKAERSEVAAFLKWLMDDGFVFLGYLQWKTHDPRDLRAQAPNTHLGVGGLGGSYGEELETEVREEILGFSDSEELFQLTKLRSESRVQRRTRLTSLIVRELSADGRHTTFHAFLGLFTSKALTQESSSIPLIREKVRRLLAVEMVLEQSHDYKFIVNIIDSMPKDEALRMTLDELQAIVRTALDVQNRNDTRVSIRFDSGNRGATILIVLPRDRFNSVVRQELQKYIESEFQATPGSSEYFLDLSHKPHARIYFQLPLVAGDQLPINIAKLKVDIARITRSWEDNLEELLEEVAPSEANKNLILEYRDAFSDDYKALHTPADAVTDIGNIQHLSPQTPIRLAMDGAGPASKGVFTLVVYSLGTEITISRAFPILENAGLEVISEKSTQVHPYRREAAYVHRFLVRPKGGNFVTSHVFESYLAPGLEHIFLGDAENDLLNSLFITANLDTRAIALLRTYCGLLWQITKFASRSVLLDALASNPLAANQLWNMFEIRFHPDQSGTIASRQTRFESGLSHFKDGLRSISDITQDRILRALADLLQHTLRTNFYQDREAIAVKIHSARVEVMPTPRPLYEIYVHAKNMEAVHLRVSRIARGGLRWSDRHQDFRTEVLGLMKTQNIKNALIVPGGAKGGFVVRDLPADKTAQQEAVKAAYKTFIRALLSLTDNREQTDTIPPERVVAYDEPDPYLVVAADKGTATFSDTANQVALNEFHFWLGDAFASGGSQGYDHKRYGITAKGAWESVIRHFKNIGLNYENEPFTAIGIGDMSGDVFGNGLILSKNVRLIAAFNHRHIFLDPNPEPGPSYEERLRLFQTPGSQWDDYSENLLSVGGAVYNRFDKEITLSREARSALSIPEDVPETIDGESVIAHVLRAQVDLLWNGGIGTYVKAPNESHADVNDGTNDRVRVNSDELRARVVGEGGNLGFTQLARIDFARRGGNIHTDAIDNSGGVDLSDHEVNLKILLNDLVRRQILPETERNEILKEIGPQIVSDVLDHNRHHAMLLTLGVRRSRRSIEYFQGLLRELVKRGYVNRQLECLPDDDELLDRTSRKEGLVKPELAVCLAAVKMWVKDELGKSTLPRDPLLASYLLSYFPDTIRRRFSAEIQAHPLAPNIISTQATNILVDMMGVTFLHRMCLNHSATPISIIKCALAAEMILGGRQLRNAAQKFDNYEHSKIFMQLIEEINGALRDLTSWLLNTHGDSLTLVEMVDRYRGLLRSLLKDADTALVGPERDLLVLRQGKYREYGLSEEHAVTFASLPRVMLLFEILWASNRASLEVSRLAVYYTSLLGALDLHSLFALEFATETRNKWEQEVLMMAFRDMRRSISRLSLSLIEQGVPSESLTSSGELEKFINVELIRSLIHELREGSHGVAPFVILSKHLQGVSHG